MEDDLTEECPRAAPSPLVLSVSLETMQAPSPSSRADDISLGGKVVLVVEDDPIILETTVENLQDLGYATLSALDAAEAIALLSSDAQIDLMFSDVVMPGGMNGVELAERAKQLRPGMPVALTSGYSAATVDGLPPGIPLLPKPYLRADLARTLAGLVAN